MSIIVAVKHGDTVYMGADTQITYGDGEKRNSLLESDRKIHKFENGLLVGATGAADDILRVIYNKTIFEIPQEGLTKKFVVNEIVPKLFAYFKEKDCLVAEKNDDDAEKSRMRCSFVLAYKNKIIYIHGDFGVWENARFCAAGAGGSYAFPYLEAFDHKDDVNGQLVRAMRGCAKHDNSISAPFILIDSKNLTYTVTE